MTVAELRRRMSTAEKAAWMAYDRYQRARRKQAREQAELESEAQGG
jgi:hypothetical protein